MWSGGRLLVLFSGCDPWFTAFGHKCVNFLSWLVFQILCVPGSRPSVGAGGGSPVWFPYQKADVYSLFLRQKYYFNHLEKSSTANPAEWKRFINVVFPLYQLIYTTLWSLKSSKKNWVLRPILLLPFNLMGSWRIMDVYSLKMNLTLYCITGLHYVLEHTLITSCQATVYVR